MIQKNYNTNTILGGECEVQGCGLGILTLDMSTMPEMEGGTPLREIKPLKFFINSFKDNVLKNPEGTGDIVEPFFYKIDPRILQIHINKSGSDIFKKAIEAELIRNGHIVVDPYSRSDADVVISGKFQNLTLNHRPRVFVLDLYSSVEAEIIVNVCKESITKTYTGFYDCENPKLNPHFGAEEWENCLKYAILDLTKNFLIDPDFIHLINQNKE